MLLHESTRKISISIRLNYQLMKNPIYAIYNNSKYRVINIRISSSRSSLLLLPNNISFDDTKFYLDSKASKYVIRINDSNCIERFFDSNNNPLLWNDLCDQFFNNEYYYREF